MIRLGLVLHISSNQHIIVKIENTPKIGEMVVDENLKPVGEVFDIFGPVSAPYAAVKPKTSKLESLVKKTVYIIPSKKKMGKI
ncbi:MAG: Gar1/Naf1 family protein [Candidatus Bathyarchaeia archaeon]